MTVSIPAHSERFWRQRVEWAKCLSVIIWTCPPILYAQQAPATVDSQPEHPLEKRIQFLEQQVAELKSLVRQLQISQSAGISSATETANLKSNPAEAQSADLSREDRSTLTFLRDTTINLGLDTYYAYNFNQPVGRVNLLRGYDVLSNEFSLNQALRKNLTKCAFYAALCNVMNSVLVNASRCALSNRYLMSR